MLVALYSGIPSAEALCELRIEDYIPEPPALRWSAGQDYTGRHDIDPLKGRTAEIMANWIVLRGARSGGLFLPVDHRGWLKEGMDNRIGQHTARAVVEKRYRQSGLPLPITERELSIILSRETRGSGKPATQHTHHIPSNKRKEPLAEIPRDITSSSGFGETLVSGGEAPPGTHPALRWLVRIPRKRKEQTQVVLENVARFASCGETGADRLAWHRLRFWHTAAIRAALMEMDLGSYTTVSLEALRRVLDECLSFGQIEPEEHMLAKKHAVRNQRALDRDLTGLIDSLPKRPLSDWEIVSLLEACEQGRSDTSTGRTRRDATLISLLYVGSMPPDQIAALQVEDRDLAMKYLTQDNVQRDEDIVELAAKLLNDYLDHRGQWKGAMFGQSSIGNGYYQPQHWHTNRAKIMKVVRFRAGQAHKGSFSPRDPATIFDDI